MDSDLSVYLYIDVYFDFQKNPRNFIEFSHFFYPLLSVAVNGDWYSVPTVWPHHSFFIFRGLFIICLSLHLPIHMDMFGDRFDILL
jgi:hypothetical protein